MLDTLADSSERFLTLCWNILFLIFLLRPDDNPVSATRVQSCLFLWNLIGSKSTAVMAALIAPHATKLPQQNKDQDSVKVGQCIRNSDTIGGVFDVGQAESAHT